MYREPTVREIIGVICAVFTKSMLEAAMHTLCCDRPMWKRSAEVIRRNSEDFAKEGLEVVEIREDEHEEFENEKEQTYLGV